MKVAHPWSALGHADEHRRSYRDEGFNVSKIHLERLRPTADILERLQRPEFPTLQPPRRKDGHVRGQMRQFRMQFPAEVLNKFPDSILHISHQGITRILHVNPKLYLRRRAAWVTRNQKRSAIIDKVGA